jgi:hypothetical protein
LDELYPHIVSWTTSSQPVAGSPITIYHRTLTRTDNLSYSVHSCAVGWCLDLDCKATGTALSEYLYGDTTVKIFPWFSIEKQTEIMIAFIKLLAPKVHGIRCRSDRLILILPSYRRFVGLCQTVKRHRPPPSRC